MVKNNVFLAEYQIDGVPPGSATRFLERAGRSAELLASNVSPELILDALALAWPRRTSAA